MIIIIIIAINIINRGFSQVFDGICQTIDGVLLTTKLQLQLQVECCPLVYRPHCGIVYWVSLFKLCGKKKGKRRRKKDREMHIYK